MAGGARHRGQSRLSGQAEPPVRIARARRSRVWLNILGGHLAYTYLPSGRRENCHQGEPGTRAQARVEHGGDLRWSSRSANVMVHAEGGGVRPAVEPHFRLLQER